MLRLKRVLHVDCMAQLFSMFSSQSKSMGSTRDLHPCSFTPFELDSDLTALLYAGDVVLVAESQQYLQQMLSVAHIDMPINCSMIDSQC